MKKTTKQHLSDVNKFFSINKEGLKKKTFIFRHFSILRATKEPVSNWIQVWGLDDRDRSQCQEAFFPWNLFQLRTPKT